MVVAVVAILLLIGVLWLAAGRPAFSNSRARLRTSSVTGPNTGLLLATFGIAELLLALVSMGDRAGVLLSQHAYELGALGLVLVIALVVAPKADRLLGLVGVASGITGVFVEHGFSDGVLFIVMLVLLLVFLGFIRGLLPGK